MRDILFRGKWKGTKVWVYGDLICSYDKDRIAIETRDGHVCETEYDTVGQYTGFKDKNNQFIFEGDIVKLDDTIQDPSFPPYTGEVVMNRGAWSVRQRVGVHIEYCFNTLYTTEYSASTVEIMGNVIDNPELLTQL